MSFASAAMLAAACDGEPGWSGQVAVADAAFFQSTVYPVVMRDCAFSECHGAEHRYFQVFGPGRTRLPASTETGDPVTDMELQISYQRALSMLATESGRNVTDALLLSKPLEAKAGGVGHLGVDEFGRNLYASTQAAGYQALLRWAEASRAQPGAVAGSNTAASGTAGGVP